jgi:excinuclease UvrABC helicase subunit UvrB
MYLVAELNASETPYVQLGVTGPGKTLNSAKVMNELAQQRELS